MIEFIKPVAEWGSAILEVTGIGIIVLIASYAIISGMITIFRNRRVKRYFSRFASVWGVVSCLAWSFWLQQILSIPSASN